MRRQLGRVGARCVAAAALVACSLAWTGAPAQAADVPDEMVLFPAEPLEGGTKKDPTPIEQGTALVSLGPSSEGNTVFSYQMEDPRAVLHVSIVSGLGNEKDFQMAIDQPRCTSAWASEGYGLDDMFYSEGFVTLPDKARCRTGERAFGVANLSSEPHDVRVVVAEEPVVEKPGWNEEVWVGTERAKVSGDPVPREGGATPEAAALIGPGRWSATLRPEGSSWFAIPVAQGQSVRYRVTSPAGEDQAKDLTLSRLSAALLDPMLTGPKYGNRDGTYATWTEDAVVEGNSLAAGGLSTGEAWQPLPGTYRLGLVMTELAEGAEVPVVIEIEVVGTERELPTYAGGEEWSLDDALGVTTRPREESDNPTGGETPEPEETTTTEPGTETSGTEDDTRSASASDEGRPAGRTAGGVVSGVVGLGLVAAAFALRRRPRVR